MWRTLDCSLGDLEVLKGFTFSPPYWAKDMGGGGGSRQTSKGEGEKDLNKKVKKNTFSEK